MAGLLIGFAPIESTTHVAAQVPTDGPDAARSIGDVDQVPTDIKQLFAYLKSGAYGNFDARESQPHPSRGPHTRLGLPVRVFLNPTLNASLSSGNGAHPEGAAAIKEMFTAGGALQGWAVMVKTSTSGDGGDTWFWYETTDMDDLDNIVAGGNGVALCYRCHAPGADFVLTGYPLG